MKHKFSSMGRVAIALVLALSLTLVMAVPVAASHDSTATIAFTLDATTQQGQESSLDVTVTNSLGSLGDITEVVIDFNTGTTETEFTALADPITGPGTWTGTVADNKVTFTGDTIAPAADAVFVIPVQNPAQLGSVPNPTVSATDAGSNAKLEASEATGWIGYTAVPSGTAGNAITIEYLDADSYSTLSVTVVGSAISVELADSGSGPTSDADAVAAEMTGDAGALVDATVADGKGAETVPVMSATALSGGSAVQEDKPCDVTGELVITELKLTVVITANPDTSASMANYDIGFTTLGGSTIATGGTIVITFPAGYDLTTAPLVEGDISMTIGGVSYTGDFSVDVTEPVVTIADFTVAIAGESVVVVTITNTPVKNPPASDDYYIAVLTSAGDQGDGKVTIIPDSFGVVAGTLNEVTAGAAFAVTVTALNAAEPAETDIGYTGAHFIDFAWVGAPTGTIPTFELITFTAGAGTSPANFILTDTSELTIAITATDADVGFFGDSLAITINPGALASFTITNTTTTTEAGAIFGANVSVEALDAEGNRKTDYTGTVIWSSTDTAAGVTLPANYQFDTGEGDEDNGIHAFDASDFILVTVGEEAGAQTITVADGEVEEESGDITVTAADADYLTAEASVDFLVADGFDTSIITASARDEFGNLCTTEAITFVTNLGVFDEPDPDSSTYTAASGEAVATLKSSEIGTATIKVTSTTLTTPITVTVDMVERAVVADIVVTAVKDLGANTYTVTATYVDTLDEKVTAADGANYAVTFSTDPVVIDPHPTTAEPTLGVATLAEFTTTLGPGETIIVTATGAGKSGTVEITVGVYTSEITLEAGWNLISLPLIPENSDIDIVLAGITDETTVEQVRTWDQGIWHNWASTPPEPSNLITDMEDGQGFWVASAEGGTLEVSGYELCGPFPALPPSYDVVSGWNMIGYKFTEAGVIAIYLGAVNANLEAIYGYNATTGLYVIPDHFEPGWGYWIALTSAGIIYPEFEVYPAP